MKINEDDFGHGVEVDIGSVHVTPEGYGRLTIRKQNDHFDIYDLDNETVVESSEELEPLVEKANQLTPMTFEYDEDNVPAW